MIFIPAGCPHHVRNLDDTVAVSANFIGEANAAAAEAELEVLGLSSPRCKELLAVLRSPQLREKLERDSIDRTEVEEHRPWRQ